MNTALMKRAVVGTLAALSLTVGGVATAAVTAGDASAAVYPVGTVQGHPAFAIGPYGSKSACQPRADILNRAGAKRYGSLFGECYYKNGAWWARSPWVA